MPVLQTVRRVAVLLVAGILSAPMAVAHQAHAPVPSAGGLTLKWLGTAGWEIRFQSTTILVDPFPTRREPVRGKQWVTDEEAMLTAIGDAKYIFTGHSHADHIADIPCIVNRFNSKVIGSWKTNAILHKSGLSKSQLKPVKSGEEYDFDTFRVKVIDSKHGTPQPSAIKPEFQEIKKPCPVPLMSEDFRTGSSYLYYFTFGKYRVLHQSTGGFIKDKLKGLHPDIALLYPMQRSDTKIMLKALRPKVVFVHHFDQWRTPYSDGIPPRKICRACDYADEVEKIDPDIEVIIPEFLKRYTFGNTGG